MRPPKGEGGRGPAGFALDSGPRKGRGAKGWGHNVVGSTGFSRNGKVNLGIYKKVTRFKLSYEGVAARQDGRHRTSAPD